ncbi:MAG TPA: helix-turn-helix domain-containing protein [Ilumatobacter sp.]|nr:helix-turn-helix domain-containing protein [Ilumatobacter sp.]
MVTVDGYTVHETAKLLNVNRARVNAMITAGELKAIKFGGRWIINSSEIRRTLATERTGGRPWGQQRCWDFIRAATTQQLVAHAWQLRRRAVARDCGLLTELTEQVLADKRLVLGGERAASKLGAAISASNHIEAYVIESDLDQLESEYSLYDTDESNLTLHIVHNRELLAVDNGHIDGRAAWLDLHERMNRGTKELQYVLERNQ